MQNSPSPKLLKPRMSMIDQMGGSMPQSGVMEPANPMSSMPSMPMSSPSTVTMAESNTNQITSMPRMPMNDPMTGSLPESSVSMSSMAPESSSMLELPSMSGMPPMSSASSSSSMQAMGALNPNGCTPPMMFRPGYNISSLPPRTCSNTTSPLLKISANATRGWLALNLVNAGAVSKLAVSLDAHSMFVYTADGLFTAVQEVKVSSSSSKLTVQSDFFRSFTYLLANDTR